MGDWNKTGQTNWRLEDRSVVADKRTSKSTAHLVTKETYKNFQLYIRSIQRFREHLEALGFDTTREVVIRMNFRADSTS